MLTSLVSVALFAVAATSFDLTGLPSCGETCVVNSVDSQTQCATTDTSCLCGDQSLGYNIGYCLGSTCDTADMEVSLDWLSKACSQPVVTNTAASGATATGSEATSTATSALIVGSGGGSSSGSSSSGHSSSAKYTKHGLSSGAKGGIGGAVAVVVLAIIGVLLKYWKGKKSKTAVGNVESNAAEPTAPAAVEHEKLQPQVNVQQVYPGPQQGYVPPPMQQPPPGMPVYNQAAPPYEQHPPVSPMSTYAQPVAPPQMVATPPPQPLAPGLQGVSSVPPGFQSYHPQQQTLATPPQPQAPELYGNPSPFPSANQAYQPPPQPMMQPATQPMMQPGMQQPQTVYEAPAQYAAPQGNIYEAPGSHVPS